MRTVFWSNSVHRLTCKLLVSAIRAYLSSNKKIPLFSISFKTLTKPCFHDRSRKVHRLFQTICCRYSQQWNKATAITAKIHCHNEILTRHVKSIGKVNVWTVFTTHFFIYKKNAHWIITDFIGVFLMFTRYFLVVARSPQI